MISDFWKSTIGLCSGALVGFAVALMQTIITHNLCAAKDPNNFGAITLSAVTIPFCTFVGAVIGAVLSDKYWFTKPTVKRMDNLRSRPIARPRFVFRICIFMAIMFLILRLKESVIG